MRGVPRFRQLGEITESAKRPERLAEAELAERRRHGVRLNLAWRQKVFGHAAGYLG
jgi:hypothetical protein